MQTQEPSKESPNVNSMVDRNHYHVWAADFCMGGGQFWKFWCEEVTYWIAPSMGEGHELWSVTVTQ